MRLGVAGPIKYLKGDKALLVLFLCVFQHGVQVSVRAVWDRKNLLNNVV